MHTNRNVHHDYRKTKLVYVRYVAMGTLHCHFAKDPYSTTTKKSLTLLKKVNTPMYTYANSLLNTPVVIMVCLISVFNHGCVDTNASVQSFNSYQFTHL